jgi:CBS domain-containing protein
MSQLREILQAKGSTVYQIDGEATVFDAIRRMVEANIGALLVSERGAIVGIVTERDYLRRVTLEGRTDRETRVREIMTSPLVTVTPQTTVDECMTLMTERRIRHAPVLEDGEVVGVVSIGDLVKFVSREQSHQIQYLTDYISR